MNEDSQLETLMQRFLEDRDSLDEQELAALLHALEQSPDAARRLKEQLLIDHLLTERLAVDRGGFPNQVRQRLRDLDTGEAELTRQVDAMQRLATQQVRQYRRRIGLARIARGAAVLAAVLAIAAAFIYIGPQWGAVAQLQELQGDVLLTRHGKSRPAKLGELLHPGDELLAPAKSEARWVYNDGTEIRLEPGSSARLELGPRKAKHIALLQGAAQAQVTPQPEDAPLLATTRGAQARVLGTAFTLWSSPRISRLEVSEGRVQWARLAESGNAAAQPQEALVVSASQWAVAAENQLVVNPSNLPADHRGLVFCFQAEHAPRVLAGESLAGGGFTLRPRGAVEMKAGILDFNGGALLAPTEAAERLLTTLRQTNEFTLEAVVQTATSPQQGPAHIFALAAGAETPNLALGQQGDVLTLELKLSDADKPAEDTIYLFPLGDREPHHVLVSYSAGTLRAWLDGRLIVEDSRSLSGDFSSWQLQPLALGDDWNGGRPWLGKLHSLAVFSRAFDDARAASHAARSAR